MSLKHVHRCSCGAWAWRGRNCHVCSILLMRWCKEGR